MTGGAPPKFCFTSSTSLRQLLARTRRLQEHPVTLVMAAEGPTVEGLVDGTQTPRRAEMPMGSMPEEPDYLRLILSKCMACIYAS
jgi:hypothetical protein